MIEDNKVITKTNHCTAFCPECGSDLAFMDGECFCKKRDCYYHCNCECQN